MKIEDSSEIPGKEIPYWLDNIQFPNYPPLKGDVKTEIVVIGGGIAGIMTAHFLKMAGQKFILIEKDKILHGVTGHTTAKLTSQHNLIYDYLINNFGKENAGLYAEANQTAIEKVATLIDERKIDCDFQRRNAYTFALTPEEKEMVQKETEVAKSLGLPASFIGKTDLPFETLGAVCFENQAIFHPVKFLLALAETLTGEGGQIFENTRALSIGEGSPNKINTDRGQITAKGVIVATNFPIYDKCSFFARMWPRRSYALAARLKGKPPQGYYISTSENYRSVRPHFPDDNVVLINGNPHKTGQAKDTVQKYHEMVNYAQRHFNIKSISWHWSTQDNFPNDRIPYIGRASLNSKNIWVATGFKGWGMSHGIVSGILLSDLVLGKNNPYKELFDPCRTTIKTSAREFVKQNVNVAQKYISGHLSENESRNLKDIKNGEGKIMEIKGNKIAAYKDNQGKLHTLSPVCQHLGCIVAWNNAEKSWDCPCHGSRYTAEGKVIHSPTTKDLPKIKLD
jgi:glycine/D-amino acid oxidase-like deaminating enzyme/nitrite reductase/ring-hydroxylating ferredoxin subunit